MQTFYFLLLVSASCLNIIQAQNPTTAPYVVEVCYDHVGCFNNATPFNNAHGVLPADPNKMDIQVILFSRDNLDSADNISFTDITTVSQSHFKAQRPTKFIIHGFTGSFEGSTWMFQIKDALLAKGDFNVLMVDWGKGATFPDYDQASANVRSVASVVKLVIDELVSQGLNHDDLHLIGHSLGAQMSGAIGRLVGPNTVGRISGLDPAEPNFDKLPNDVELERTDGKFVDILHTNGDTFGVISGFGLMTPVGHVDFYANGGRVQRGCAEGGSGISAGLDAFINQGGDIFDTVGTGTSCSHGRAHQYFLESLTNSNCSFRAFPCESYEKFENGECMSCAGGCSVAGFDADQYQARGIFYFDTAGESPYCGVYYHMKLYPSSSAINTTGTLFVKVIGTKGSTNFTPVTVVNGPLSSSTRLNMNLIFQEYVGTVTDVEVKYEREVGFFSFLTTSQPEFYISGIEITSDDSGASYGSCSGDFKLLDKQSVALSMQNGRPTLSSPCPASTVIG